MYNPNTQLRIRRILTIAQRILSLILLALKIFEKLQSLHLI